MGNLCGGSGVDLEKKRKVTQEYEQVCTLMGNLLKVDAGDNQILISAIRETKTSYNDLVKTFDGYIEANEIDDASNTLDSIKRLRGVLSTKYQKLVAEDKARLKEREKIEGTLVSSEIDLDVDYSGVINLEDEDELGPVKKEALEEVITEFINAGIEIPEGIIFNIGRGGRAIAFSTEEVIEVGLCGDTINKVNPIQFSEQQSGIKGGVGSGNRGVANQVYDIVYGNTEGSEDVKKAAALKAQVKAVAIHEMGHVLHSRNNGGDKYWELKGLSQGGTGMSSDQVNLAMGISHYATVNALEVVAEVWTGVKNGLTYSSAIMNMYEEFEGPAV